MTPPSFPEQWAFVLEHRDQRVRRAAQRAFEDPTLRQLFPYSSMSNLRFSRTSEYPYDSLPYVRAGENPDEYEARDVDNRPLAEGNIDLVVRTVAATIQTRC